MSSEKASTQSKTLQYKTAMDCPTTTTNRMRCSSAMRVLAYFDGVHHNRVPLRTPETSEDVQTGSSPPLERRPQRIHIMLRVSTQAKLRGRYQRPPNHHCGVNAAQSNHGDKRASISPLPRKASLERQFGIRSQAAKPGKGPTQKMFYALPASSV
jgi:hypothetical protein